MRVAFARRVRYAAIGITLVAVLFLARLYVLQVVHSDDFEALADDQYIRPSHTIFERGAIYLEDKDGRLIAGATTHSGYMLTVNPTRIHDATTTYSVLSKYVELDKDTFLERATRENDPYEEIAHEIEKETADAIRQEDLAGVQLFHEQWRYYPGGTLAAHSLGFIGYGVDGSEQTGQYGLERYWDDSLTRETTDLHVNFFAELFGNAGGPDNGDEGHGKGDLVTSLEPNVQLHLEKELAHVKEEWGAREIGAVVMDPKDGRILALAAYPSFNPNDRTEVTDAHVYTNPLVSSVYEMGSIMKPIAMSIGLNTDSVSAKTTYYDGGSVDIDGYTIRNYDGRGRGTVSMQEVLNQSLNTGMAFVVQQTGNERIGSGLRAFGIGEETGIDLPGEARGLVDNLDSPRDVEYATASFGQGIAITPVAMTRALAALANKGKLVTPHLVTGIRYPSGHTRTIDYEEHEQAISEAASEEITRMLVEVVDSSLRGGTVAKEHYSIAAKTGTAQIANVRERGYYDDRFLHSFFGYFPAYEPRFIVFLYHLEPQGARYASETLTVPFMNIADFLINYYEIPPDR